MKRIYLLSFCLISVSSYAQPEITNGANIADLTFSYPLATASTTNAGTAGANQTWDFSALTFTDIGTLSVVDKSSTTFASDFPSANWCYMMYPTYSYFEITATEMLNWASMIASTGGNNDYSNNPKKVLAFPFNYLDTYSDFYEENSSISQVDVTYDGYGTLVMPGGFTYYNVVRVNESYSGNDDYRWYSLNPLMSIAVFDGNTNTMYWVKSDLTGGLAENKTSNSILIFPNPSSTDIQINFTSTNSEESLEIYSLSGALVKAIKINCTQTEMSYKLSTSELTKGIYTLKIGDSTQSFEVL